ncbi:hypothetical protein AX14_010064 [Amanita brunnescens Koide BX004]|nr:hypothetical protein AX14_010064 [Amanita brunnescens Koide BX004]
MSEQQQLQHNRMWLNNYAGRHGLGKVEYINEVRDGQRVWKSTVQINGTEYGSGEASRKDQAQEIAAKQALARLAAEATG